MSMPAEHLPTLPTLSELLKGYADAPPLPVNGIASDSRRLRDGYVFLACKGINRHGLDYLAEARAAGARAIVYDASTAPRAPESDVMLIAVENLQGKLGEIANRFYGRPSEALRVIGVTGTNGKTTVAWLVAKCAEELGIKSAYLGTLGYGVETLQPAQGMTTPAAIELQERLAGFVKQDADIAAVEVSSHALAQGRVDGVLFETALFTNLSRDHLDYHADMRHYFEAKARLFLENECRHRIVNIDSDFGVELATRCGSDVVVVSADLDRVTDARPYAFVRSVTRDGHGSNITFISSWGDGQFHLGLPGDFNVSNAILVLACLLQQGVAVDAACDALTRVPAPPGRMQRVDAEGPSVYVDFAHTPTAIEAALRALRPHCRGKLWCIFGCGGQRDAGKRPLMASLAETFADRVVVSSDNPRTEDPLKIIDQVVAGLARPEAATIIEDRAAAIAWVIRQADPSDAVLIAGKGHEDYQEIGTEKRPFSDYTVAKCAMTAAASEGVQ